MITNFKFSFAILIFASALFTGCNMMDNNATNSNLEHFLTITPTDNSQNIGINEVITLKFATFVDINAIENNFVLISQIDAADSACPVNKNMGHSDLEKDMMDTSMMNHLKLTHRTEGNFNWNSDRTICEFKSDSPLSPNTDYMLYINSDMVKHMKNMMFNIGMMNGVMGMMNCNCGNKGMDKSYFTTRFRTKNY